MPHIVTHGSLGSMTHFLSAFHSVLSRDMCANDEVGWPHPPSSDNVFLGR